MCTLAGGAIASSGGGRGRAVIIETGVYMYRDRIYFHLCYFSVWEEQK